MAVKKAVITAAGRGTRQYPASSAVHKEMFPLVDRDGLTKPVIQIIGEEAMSAGIKSLCIVTAPGEENRYREYFRGLSESMLPAFSDKSWALAESNRLERFESMLHFVAQQSAEGYGHAVWCAKEFVGDDPFLLLLGDHIYLSDGDCSCAQQLITAYHAESCGSITAVQRTHESQLAQFGTTAGEPIPGRPGIYRASAIAEKPTVEYAKAHLRTPGLDPTTYICHFGMHVFSAQLFEILDRHVADDIRYRGEIQLTPAQQQLRDLSDGAYLLAELAGKRYDTGIPYGLTEAQLALALRGVHREQILASIQELCSDLRIDDANGQNNTPRL